MDETFGYFHRRDAVGDLARQGIWRVILLHGHHYDLLSFGLGIIDVPHKETHIMILCHTNGWLRRPLKCYTEVSYYSCVH